MHQRNIILLLSIVLLSSGCTAQDPTPNAIHNVDLLDGTELAAGEIAKLSPLDMNSVDSFERYKDFADKFNTMAKILNEKMKIFDIPALEPTQEGYEKASKAIVKYTPLIDNYNGVVLSAKSFNRDDKSSVDKFYTESGQFALETTLIVGSVFWSTTYMGVGTVYRASGLNVLAFKCGACISAVLSDAYWTVNIALVEGSSQAAKQIIEGIGKIHNLNIQSSINSTYHSVVSKLKNASFPTIT